MNSRGNWRELLERIFCITTEAERLTKFAKDQKWSDNNFIIVSETRVWIAREAPIVRG